MSFDGLRPDLIDPSLTPNLARLQRQGTTLANHRTIFPSETRSAFPSLVTGATSNVHGMVGNKYVDRQSAPPRYVDTSDSGVLERLNRESGGRLMTAPTLGEILAAQGRSLAVLATNTPGTTRLFHHQAEQYGDIRLSGHFGEVCTPGDFLMEVEAGFGRLPPLPPKGAPDIEAQTLITSVFLDMVWPKHRPDLTILSYGEPDTCSHLNGTGADATRSVIEHCDAQFGRVLDWWEAEGAEAGVQIVALSDHGHITGHTNVSVVDTLRKAGLRADVAPGPDVAVVVVPGQVGALYLTDPNEAQLAEVANIITQQVWCGPTFSAPKNEVEGMAPGTFSSKLVFADHSRAPDLYFAFKADDSIDPFGLVGGTYYDNDRLPGLGLHGGLHPIELSALGCVAGSAIDGSGLVSVTPSSICDFAPTMLFAMDLEPHQAMTGRVLHEVLTGQLTPDSDPQPIPEILETGLGDYSQSLRRRRVGPSVYLDGGWAGSDSGTHARQSHLLGAA